MAFLNPTLLIVFFNSDFRFDLTLHAERSSLIEDFQLVETEAKSGNLEFEHLILKKGSI